jgi:COP9 signalosome complex subunit 4
VSAFQQAIMEHNLESMMYAYENVSFDHLSEILGVSVAQAEKLAAKLICDQRVRGYIDQIDGFVYFDNVASSSPHHPVSDWNANVVSVSHRLNDIVETITNKLV